MTQVEFQYNSISTIIQCNEDQKMSEICHNFISKSNLDENNINFIYNGIAGKQFDKNLTFNQMANSLDKTRKKMNILVISNDKDALIKAKNIILATGSSAYPKTGSSGDGYTLAKNLGHNTTKNMGGLCPVEIKEKWINKLKGITITTKIEIKANNKKIANSDASLLFTHKGLSGYAILDNSMKIESNLRKNKEVTILIDLARDYSYEELDRTLQEDFKNNPKKHLKGYLHKYIPKNMCNVLIKHLNIEDKTLNQITKQERVIIRDNLKKIKLTVLRVCQEDAIVQNSGILQKEIDPNTLESRVVPNLYITGELIEGCGICGGFNLQKAFSTGVLAACSINMKN